MMLIIVFIIIVVIITIMVMMVMSTVVQVVVDSGMFSAPCSYRSLALALQSLQFQAVLFFPKVLCYSLHVFLQPVFQSFGRHFQGSNYNRNGHNLRQALDLLYVLSQITVIVCFFLFFHLKPFVTRHSIKVTLFLSFVPQSYVRPSVLNHMVCLDVKIPQ